MNNMNFLEKEVNKIENLRKAIDDSLTPQEKKDAYKEFMNGYSKYFSETLPKAEKEKINHQSYTRRVECAMKRC